MYDGKNSIYALKKEVAVLASPPHYAMFSQPFGLGSEHDYKLFKLNYKAYTSYLQKLANEQNNGADFRYILKIIIN